MRSGILTPLLDSNETLISISVEIAIRQRLQVLNQIVLFAGVQAQVFAGVIMLNDVQQGGKAAVVIEAGFLMRPQSREPARQPLQHYRWS